MNRHLGNVSEEMVQAVELLKNDWQSIHTVYEWAELLDYRDVTSFSDAFRRYYGFRPQKFLIAFRVNETLKILRNTDMSCYEIAIETGLKDEKALNKFICYHTGYSPREIRNLSERKNSRLTKVLRKRLGTKIRE